MDQYPGGAATPQELASYGLSTGILSGEFAAVLERVKTLLAKLEKAPPGSHGVALDASGRFKVTPRNGEGRR